MPNRAGSPEIIAPKIIQTHKRAVIWKELSSIYAYPSIKELKRPVPSAALIENYGLESDAHAGSGHRQVSLLNETDIELMRAKGLQLKPGAFGENLIVRGLDLSTLGIETRLQIGKAELELTQIGKVCHNHCAIYYQTGDCIMPRAGIFARVTKGGDLSPGILVKPVMTVSREVLQAAVLTVSDSCSAGEAIDTAGPAVSGRLESELGANICWNGIVTDEAAEISGKLEHLSERGIDLILTVGGTGCASRDVTPEATRAVIEKEAPGLAEAMRISSARITPNALLQRGVCGIYRSTLIINLPGSEKAAVENLEAVLQVIPHAVKLLRGETAHMESDIGRKQGVPKFS